MFLFAFFFFALLQAHVSFPLSHFISAYRFHLEPSTPPLPFLSFFRVVYTSLMNSHLHVRFKDIVGLVAILYQQVAQTLPSKAAHALPRSTLLFRAYYAITLTITASQKRFIKRCKSPCSKRTDDKVVGTRMRFNGKGILTVIYKEKYRRDLEQEDGAANVVGERWIEQ